MKRLILLVLVCVTVFFTAEAQSSLSRSLWWSQREETVVVLGKGSYTPYQDEYEKMLYPTVRISSPSGVGSGVIFNHKDTKDTKNTIYILTACHVVEKRSVVDIELYNSTVITGTVVITDTAKDLALIKSQINTDSKVKIYTARLADKNYIPYLFSPVWAVGCSLGLDPRPSYGHITHIEKSNQCSSVSICGYEISAPVLPGNSGGPVYDARTFEVIGIAVWVKVYQYQLVTTMAGIVPINQIYEFLTEYERTKEPKN